MSDAHAIEEVASRLRSAQTYSAIFGSIAQGSREEQKRSLRKSFTFLVRMVHPDHAPAHCAKEAAEAFTLLTRTRDAALEAIERGTYATESILTTDAANTVTFVSKAATYTARSTPLFTGDLSHIYAGSRKGSSERVHLKIALAPPHNTWLEREALVLSRLAALPDVARFVPRMRDSFLAHGDGGALHRVNVTDAADGLVSVASILRARPDGLDPEDATWIARRVFAQAVLAKMVGVVHSAIVPDHVLVHPVKREPLHLGWIHSVDAKPHVRITHVIDRYRAWYPPEVFDTKCVDERTDIAMAARVAIALYSGGPDLRKLPKTIPTRLSRFLERCVETAPSRRISDARAALDEFTDITRAAWGRTYRPLVLPV